MPGNTAVSHGRGHGSTAVLSQGNAAVPSPASCRASASTAKNGRALPRLHPNTFYFVSCFWVTWRGKTEGWWAGQEAGWHTMLQQPQRLGLSAALALEQFKPGLLVGWKLHLPKGPFAFYTPHFKGFHVVLNSRTRAYNLTVILASFLEGSVIDDGM